VRIGHTKRADSDGKPAGCLNVVRHHGDYLAASLLGVSYHEEEKIARSSKFGRRFDFRFGSCVTSIASPCGDAQLYER
jgi:hypothetical protein